MTRRRTSWDEEKSGYPELGCGGPGGRGLTEKRDFVIAPGSVGSALGEISQRCERSVVPTHRERAGCEPKRGRSLHDPAGLRLPPLFTQPSLAPTCHAGPVPCLLVAPPSRGGGHGWARPAHSPGPPCAGRSRVHTRPSPLQP